MSSEKVTDKPAEDEAAEPEPQTELDESDDEFVSAEEGDSADEYMPAEEQPGGSAAEQPGGEWRRGINARVVDGGVVWWAGRGAMGCEGMRRDAKGVAGERRAPVA